MHFRFSCYHITVLIVDSGYGDCQTAPSPHGCLRNFHSGNADFFVKSHNVKGKIREVSNEISSCWSFREYIGSWKPLFIIWAATWQNQQNECAPSEDSDQPLHPPSLIRVFAVRRKKPRFSATHWAHGEDSETGRMPRLIGVFAGRTLILLVLSCRGSYDVASESVIKLF